MFFAKKSSGSIGMGAFLIGTSVFIITLYVVMMSVIYGDIGGIFEYSRAAFSIILIGSMCLFLVIMGAISIRKGLIEKKVKANGRRSTCVIEEFKVIGHRYGHSIWMKVKFKTS